MAIAYMVLEKETTKADLARKMQEFTKLLEAGKSVALVVKKGGLSYDEPVSYQNKNSIRRVRINMTFLL